MARKRIGWFASLAAAMGMTLLSGEVARGQDLPTISTYGAQGQDLPTIATYVARGQDPTNTTYEMPPPENLFPSPLGHPRMEDGGFYIGGGFKFFQSTNPIQNHIVAVHGLVDRDGSVGEALGTNSQPGQFIGDHSVALTTGALSGPVTFVPGWELTAGWRFQSGIAVEFSWFSLVEAHYSASATSALPLNANPGFNQENTFLTSPTYNYTQDFQGPLFRFPNIAAFANINPGATSGIWDASSQQQIEFTQRFAQYQFNIRYPLQQTDSYRLYGLFGPRAVAIWERFNWTTVAADGTTGNSGPQDQALYSNVVSNRLYGLHFGLGNEWLISTTPVGAFAISTDLEGAIFANFVDCQAKYELGDLSTGASRKIHFFTVVPEIQANINFWWYPYESIQVRAGYDAMAFFGTVAAQDPIDFNVGAVDPHWSTNVFRYMGGFNFSVAFTF